MNRQSVTGMTKGIVDIALYGFWRSTAIDWATVELDDADFQCRLAQFYTAKIRIAAVRLPEAGT